MNDMLATIIPKSDQLNADDLIGRNLTIKVERVTIAPGTEQPVSIHFAGDGGKPYRPCKSMCRVLVQTWGPDANAYIGRGMTLYRDAAVTWGGMAVGGIRISHLTDIDSSITMALTATKQSRKPFTVKPLIVQKETAKQPATLADWIATTLQGHLDACKLPADVDKITASKQYIAATEKADDAQKAEMARLLGVAMTKALAEEMRSLPTDADIVKWRISKDTKDRMARLSDDDRQAVDDATAARQRELNGGGGA
jgi:hypothetical protein